MTINDEQLTNLVKRFKNYQNPSEAQKLLVILAEKPNRSDKENRVLDKLIKAENRFIRTKLAEVKVENLLAKQNDNKRKLETRKKIIWGAALKRAALGNNAEAVAVAKYLVESGFISPRDFEVVADDFEKIKALPKNKAHFIDPNIPQGCKKKFITPYSRMLKNQENK